MQLYSEKDVEIAKVKLPDIVAEIEKIKANTLEPTLKELMSANDIVMKFVKDRKLKVYGGTSQNTVIVNKNPDDAFYPPDQLADIDFYSPDPIVDMKKLANIMFDKGYKFV